MKRFTLSISAAGFKTFFAVFAIAVFGLLGIAMKANQAAEDIWKQLGLTQDAANININVSFSGGFLQYAGAKNAKNIAVGDRASVVNQLVAYAKKYTASAAFRSEYERRRTVAKNDWMRRNPEPQGSGNVVTVESIKAAEKQRLEKQLKAAEEGLNSPNPKIKNGAPTAIANIKKQISDLDNPDNPVIKRKLDEANRMSNAIQQQHVQAMQKFEQDFPEDPRVLLKKRLQEVLVITADVDYAAELKDGYNGKKVFVNPAYERKPGAWKLAFRAGKAATDAVRASAQQWLKELNASASREFLHARQDTPLVK